MMASETGPRRGRVLLTGATGFIGRGLAVALAEEGYRVRAATRTLAALPDEIESAVVGDLRRPVNLSEAFRDVDYVIHSAGLAHSANEIPEATYREVNAGTTEILARAAKRAGVRRFVLMSSIRAQVGPESTVVVTEDMAAAPTDAYGRSKLEAEQVLAAADLPFVVLRPVLVHGPGMRFNMAELLRLARSRWPLPLGGFNARRSIVARNHLADAVSLALANEAMAEGIYVVADPEPLSVGEMVAAMRAGLSRRPGLMPVPPPLMALAGRLAGRGEQIARLRQSLVADPSRLIAVGWRPRRSAFDALSETARRIAAGDR